MSRLRFAPLVLLLACGGDEKPPGDGPGITDDAGPTDTDTPGTEDTTTPGTSDTTTTPPTGTTNGIVDAFGADRDYVTVGTKADGLARPRDLQFDPFDPTLLWTVNQETDGTVMYRNPGAADQEIDARVDFNADHFMEEVSSVAFSPDDAVFGTCQESRNTYNDQYPPNDFMGPVLWPNDLEVYAIVDGGLGSHIDMLHESPLCMGIEWDTGNAFWVFDGMNSDLVWYDFQTPHKVGGDDHSDGVIKRFSDVKLTRVPGVPGHIVLDHASGLLYVADTGTGRVLAIDPSTAAQGGKLHSDSEPLASYTDWEGATVTELVTGMNEPSGIALASNMLFVTDHGTGEIVAFDLGGAELGRISLPDGPGAMGVEVGPDGTLWYVDGEHDKLVHVVPK